MFYRVVWRGPIAHASPGHRIQSVLCRLTRYILACDDPLANPDHTQKVGHNNLLSSVSGVHKNTHVQYLCGHQICIMGTCNCNMDVEYNMGFDVLFSFTGVKMYESILGQPGWHKL